MGFYGSPPDHWAIATISEIAEIIEAPVATVKSRFSYGMVKLRSMVNKKKEVTNEV